MRESRKKIGHHTHLRENEDLPQLGAPALRQKPPCFNVRAEMTPETMRSKYAQRNTKNNLKFVFSCATSQGETSKIRNY